MEHHEARELLDLRDKAQQRLHITERQLCEAQEFLLEVESLCAEAQPELPPGGRRKRHLRVVKGIFIGAGAGVLARRLMAALALPAAAAATAVAIMTLPNVSWGGRDGTPRVTTSPPAVTSPAYTPRRRRQAAPAPGKSQPGRPGHGHRPATPSPPSPVPSTGPVLPSPLPSLPPVSTPPVSTPPVSVPPSTCVLGICVGN